MAKIDEWLETDKLILLEAWARNGLTKEQIANNIGIGRTTLYEWEQKQPNITNALKKGKEVVDIEVENALYKKALGYNVHIQKAIKLKEVIYKDGKRVKETERIEYVQEEMHVPADTTAQIFWLKNRKPNEWRDKVEIPTDTKELTKVEELLSKIENEANK